MIEEDFNEKSTDAQKLQNQEANDQLSSSQHASSCHLSITNDTTQKLNFRRISLWNPEHLISISRVYQEYIENYHKSSYFYFIKRLKNYKIEFITYDTKTKKENLKVIDLFMEKIDKDTAIAELPNGDLFCFGGRFNIVMNTFIIDRDFNLHNLPSEKLCYNSSAIYYNRNIYCFGGSACFTAFYLTVSKRFDLSQNKWFDLCPLPKPVDNCKTVIFNDNILISTYQNINLYIYSINIDSFSIIPYKFRLQTIKFMINAAERLYLIESKENWCIYESDVGDEFSWKPIKSWENMSISHGWIYSCIYNKEKESIYISSLKYDCSNDLRFYYKFNLNEKVLKGRKLR